MRKSLDTVEAQNLQSNADLGARRDGGHCYSADGRFLCCFVADRCTFAARRRRFEPRVGFVARRRAPSGAIPSATRPASLARAISRLRSCERCSEAVTVMTPAMRRRSSRVSSMSRWPSETAVESPTFQKSSTRLSEVLTCCPPGPDERENRQPSSEAGIVSAGDTSRSMPPALHISARPKPHLTEGGRRLPRTLGDSMASPVPGLVFTQRACGGTMPL